MFCDNEVKAELFLGEPSKELMKWARENIREYPETTCQVLDDFRDMIFARGECVPHRTDDAFLLRFLRGRHFVVESAHRLLVNYYDFKENHPEIFKSAGFQDLELIGPHNIVSVPPYREQTGRRILLYRFGEWNPNLFTSDFILKVTMIVLEMAMLEQQAQILGGIAIFDMDKVTMQQAWYLTPSVARKMIQIMVTSFPIKIQAVHILNQPWMFETLYNVFKPFLHERMKARLFFHGDDMASLHKFVDPKHLPKRYGGVHPDYRNLDWVEGFRKNKTILKEMESLGYNCN